MAEKQQEDIFGGMQMSSLHIGDKIEIKKQKEEQKNKEQAIIIEKKRF